jgi:hypothetical protein
VNKTIVVPMYITKGVPKNTITRFEIGGVKIKKNEKNKTRFVIRKSVFSFWLVLGHFKDDL